MTSTRSRMKLALLTALFLGALAASPSANACTPGSLLCPLDGAQQDTYAAAGAAEDAIFAAPGAADNVVPTILAAEADAFAKSSQARNDAIVAIGTELDGAFASVDATEAMLLAQATTAAASAASQAATLGDVADASMTDAIVAVDTAGAAAADLQARAVATAEGAVASVPGTIAAVTGPVEQEADDIVNEDMPALTGEVEDAVSEIDATPYLAAYEAIKTSMMGMVYHNYELLQARFPLLLPPSSAIEDLASNLP